MALVDGQMVGDLRRTVGARTVTFEIGAFRELDGRARRAPGGRGRCGRFLELDAEVVVTRR
jgi:hypothetical protein